jgi:hypothetical protein
MANEKDQIENSGEEPRKESWLKEALEKVNTDFPLSGGETEAEFEAATEVEGDEGDEEETTQKAEEIKPEGEHKSWLRDAMDNADTDFPLSGGE